METLKETVIDVVIALFLFTVTAGSCHTPRACHDRAHAHQEASKP
jgi:hypothetical protein